MAAAEGRGIELDSKVFDVSKPGRTSPEPTSRPLIVGQQLSADPMVTASEPAIPSTPIHVSMADEEAQTVPANLQVPEGDVLNPGLSDNDSDAEHEIPHATAPPAGATIPPNEMDHLEEPAPSGDSVVPGSNFTPLTSLIPSADADDKEGKGEFAEHHVDKLPELHDDGGHHEVTPLQPAPGAGPKRRWTKVLLWLFIIALIAVVGAYLAVDAGLVKSDVKLPFHIFNKQKTTVVKVAPPPATPVSQAPVQSSVPEGFAKYTVESSGVSFAYPTAWGAPTVTKDPGFSKRGGTNKTDGTYAHLLNFATNKDIQIALTSSKYLPATDSKQYYQFLQWCTGTNDNKIYKQTLHFTSENKVDTPGTITCDQGPLADAAKLDGATIIQAKTKDAAGAPMGDLYTKNLDSKDLTVLRVKDAQSKNGDNIKKLLAAVKVDSGSSTTNTSPSAQ